jgi:predicted lipoprotein
MRYFMKFLGWLKIQMLAREMTSSPGDSKPGFNVKLWIGTAAMLTSLTACDAFLNKTPEKSISDTSPRAASETNPFSGDDLQYEQGPFTERKMLINIGLNVLAPAVKAFAVETSMLSHRLDLACGESRRNLDRQAWNEALDQWKKSMIAYHKVDTTSMGPTAERSSSLYAWPYLNKCSVDLALIAHAQTSVASLASQTPPNLRGLGAVEYLLTEPTLKSACHPRAQPTAAQWSEADEAKRLLDRCRYAMVLAQDLQNQAQFIAQAWNPSQRNFTKSMVDGTAYPDVTQATNALTDAMFSIMSVKDQRLGRVLGLHKDCGKDSCPESIEHRDADLALKAYTQRLRQIREIFTGRDSFGLDDLLISKGHAEVARRFLELLDQAQQSLEAESRSPWASRVEALQGAQAEACKASTSKDRRDSLCAAHADIREVASYFKIQVLTALALRQPPSYQGDND